MAAKPEEPEVQAKGRELMKTAGSRCDAEIKISEGCRGYCAECAETQIESFGLKPSLGRRNCFQTHDLGYSKWDILYDPVLFLFYLTGSEISLLKTFALVLVQIQTFLMIKNLLESFECSLS